MTEYAESDLRKLLEEAVKCIQKTLQCTLCHKLPSDTVAAKCGHPFCKSCVERVLNTKRAVCSICKTVIIRSNVHKVESISKIVLDLKMLTDAIGKDTDYSIPDHVNRQQSVKQYQGIRRSLRNVDTAAGPSTSKLSQKCSVGSAVPVIAAQQLRRRSLETKKLDGRGTISSLETIKIDNDKVTKTRQNEKAPVVGPSTSKASDNDTDIFYPTDNVANTLDAMDSSEKVKNWLFKEEFESDSSVSKEFPDIDPPVSTNSSTSSENLLSFSQTASNLLASKPLSRDAKATTSKAIKTTKLRSEASTQEKHRKYQCFSLNTGRNVNKPNSKPATPAEEMFDNLCKKTPDQPPPNKKSTGPSVSTDDSWSELAQFKKETRPKVRKRRRLNVSIERPSSTKQIAQDSEPENPTEDREEKDKNADGGNDRDVKGQVKTNNCRKSPRQPKKPNVVSSRTLEENEMIDVNALNRCQLKEIVGVVCSSDHDKSKNSNTSLDKSASKLKKKELSRRSREATINDSRETVCEAETEEAPLPNVEGDGKTQSKQGLQACDSRPGSRHSIHSASNCVYEKFKLSTKRKSSPRDTSSRKVSPQPDADESIHGSDNIIQVKKTSPVRTCNDFLRNKLSLNRPSSRTGRVSNNEKPTNITITKLGKLYKPRNRIKFHYLGTSRSQLSRIKSYNATSSLVPITRHDAQTQTSFEHCTNCSLLVRSTSRRSGSRTDLKLTAANGTSYQSSERPASNESLGNAIISATRSASCNLERIGDRHRLNDIGSSQEFDTTNEVNMLSPDKDSQLKYLATKSPVVSRNSRLNSNPSLQGNNKGSTVSRESSMMSWNTIMEPNSHYMKRLRNRVAELIHTDSEEQDTEKHRKDSEESETAKKNSNSSKYSPSKTRTSLLSTKSYETTATGTRHSTNGTKSSFVRSPGNSSPKTKKCSTNSLGSESKRRSMEKRKLQSNKSRIYYEGSSDSDAENILPRTKTGKYIAVDSEASESPVNHSKQKVVRKLKYSQESKSHASSETEKSQSLDQRGSNDIDKIQNKLAKKKSFQRVRQVLSTDSEDDLVISLTTKESSNNSQKITRTGITRKVPNTGKSPIQSEEFSVEFSSNKDTQESKRKRSISPCSLDDNAIQIMAAKWCAESKRSSENLAKNDNTIISVTTSSASDTVACNKPTKKPKLGKQDSPASFESYNLPILSPTAIYGCRKKFDTTNVAETVVEINDESLSNAVKKNPASISAEATCSLEKTMTDSAATKSLLYKDTESDMEENLEEIASRFDNINAKMPLERNANSLSAIDSGSMPKTRSDVVAVSNERSITSGHTLNNPVTANKNPALTKAKSFDNPVLILKRVSQSSDKEYVQRTRGVTNKHEKRSASENSSRIVTSNEDLSTPKKSKISSDNPETEKHPASNSKRVPDTDKANTDTEPFDGSFDRDYLNITQEQLLLQELEDKLFERNTTKKDGGKKASVQDKLEKKCSDQNARKDLSEEQPSGHTANQKVKGYVVAQIVSDDSITMGEDIIERTPEKSLPSKKDLGHAGSSERLNVSRKSLTSADITPIPKLSTNLLRTSTNLSPVPEQSTSRPSSSKNITKTHSAHATYHSTPKPTTSHVKKSTLPAQSSANVEERKLCFVCSCLPLPQVQNVKNFAAKYNADYTVSYTPDVTHVIVEANDDDSAGRTLKYLLGVAHKKWIVSYRWVINSMMQGRLLEEEDYETIDRESQEPGPRRSRLRQKGIFEEFAFVCMKPFSDISINELEDLITSTGGTAVQTLEELAGLSNKHKVILHSSEIHEPEVLASWQEKGKALPVPVEWILACISQYALVSFCGYVQDVDPKVALEFGFPPELVAEEEEYSYGSNEASTSNVA